MNSSKRKEKTEAPLNFSGQPELESPSFIIGWHLDAGRFGEGVIDYLNRKFGGQSFCEIEPADFYPLRGVAIEDGIVHFPESIFYACPEKNLLLSICTPPAYEWYQFLNLILDVHRYCHAKELFIINGIVSLSAHTSPRQLWGTVNSAEFKTALSLYNVVRELDYITPPGQRPTLNSFLLWAAKRRNIPGISLMVPIPFYMVAVDDLKARRKVLEFFNQTFDLEMDFSDLDEEIRRQNQIMYEIRDSFPDIDQSIMRLESNLRLSEEESQRLVKEIDRLLKERRD